MESDSANSRISPQNNVTNVTTNITKASDRMYISREKKVNYREIKMASASMPYKMGNMIARGAESVLYSGTVEGHPICIKAVRNSLNKWIGDSQTRNQKEKLDNVAYRTKVRHINNEFEISKMLYGDGELPVVHIYALRRVKSFGLELGYDLIMEPLNGHDMADKILGKNLGIEDKLNVFMQALIALDYVHKHKIVHLDIKPSNFMMNNDKLKLLDFGVSSTLGYRPTAITGTGGYLSPEQICKESVDERTDIFALGLTFCVFFGGKQLNQPQSELMLKQTRIEAKYHLEHDEKSVIADIPELMNMPKVAEIVRNCSIPMREKRPANCGVIMSQLVSAAAAYNIKLEKK